MQSTYTFKDFLPLIAAVTLVLLATAGTLFFISDLLFEPVTTGRFFMGYFFLIFGIFKAWNISGFAKAFSMYDPLAKRSDQYAKSYPYLEILLAILYLFNVFLVIASIATIIIMSVGAYGVLQKLREKETIPCACMGAVFVIPMTWVTLAEDVLMAAMAAMILVALL